MTVRMLHLSLLTTLCLTSNLWAQMEREEFDPCQALENTTLFKPLGEISTQLFKEDGKRMPPDCSLQFIERRRGEAFQRDALPKVFAWEPTNFVHMPAYFDDVPLERYGQSHHPCLQPGFSAVRFFVQPFAMPYKIGVNRPHECITTLGHQPPGNCVPCVKQTLPYETDATLLEIVTAVGLVFMLP